MFEPLAPDPIGSDPKPLAADPKPLAPDPKPLAPSVLVSIALSGFCAMAAEVVWTRMLSLIFGATVYTFSIVLAVFLTGLGMGAWLEAHFPDVFISRR
jgi:predicted membrane-bound spermidine synthase